MLFRWTTPEDDSRVVEGGSGFSVLARILPICILPTFIYRMLSDRTAM
jgi:hypothetical protein